MGTYRVFPAKDGPRLECKAASWSDAMETLAQAYFSQLYDTSTVGFEKEVSVEVQGEDLAALAKAWIDELALLYYENGFIPGDFIVIEVGHPPMRRYGDEMMRLRATARGRMQGEWHHPAPVIRMVDGVQLSQRRSNYLVSAEMRTST